MSERRELWGSRLEFAGVLVVMLTAFWQAAFSDWWKDQLGEWQSYIQEEVNLSLLYSVHNLAELELVQDSQAKMDIVQKMRNQTARTVEKAIGERNKRQSEIKKGQAALFFQIRTSLVMLGAILFSIGKWLSLSAVRLRIARSIADAQKNLLGVST